MRVEIRRTRICNPGLRRDGDPRSYSLLLNARYRPSSDAGPVTLR